MISHITADELQSLVDRAYEFCRLRGWSRKWDKGGCYLHLESSEFIEALRGKGTESPTSEAGDVLFVLFSMIAEEGIKIEDVLASMNEKMTKRWPVAKPEQVVYEGDSPTKSIVGDKPSQ